MGTTYSSTALVSDNSTDEIRRADLDLLAKINAANTPVITTDSTYGTYRQYPDGTTQGRYLVSTSNVNEAGVLSTDFVYSKISLLLAIGTWDITSIVSVYVTTAVDNIGTSFWNDTDSLEIPNTTTVVTPSAVGFSFTITNRLYFKATKAITMKVRIKRNGASVPNVGNPAAVLKPDNTLFAISIL